MSAYSTMELQKPFTCIWVTCKTCGGRGHIKDAYPVCVRCEGKGRVLQEVPAADAALLQEATALLRRTHLYVYTVATKEQTQGYDAQTSLSLLKDIAALLKRLAE